MTGDGEPATEEPDIMPPFSAEGEEPAPADLEMEDVMLPVIQERARGGRLLLHTKRFTRNTRWGVVMRIDFEDLHNSRPEMGCRYICWRPEPEAFEFCRRYDYEGYSGKT
jgi:hypothetical protein